jgi:acyl carrier protein
MFGKTNIPESALREKIRHYILVELMRDPQYPLGDDEPIITAGLIDSFALAELAVFIENEFHLTIPNPDLTVEKMDTLSLIVSRVLRP